MRENFTTIGRSLPYRRVFADQILNAARNASCGISTLPTCFMRRLPFFCCSSSLRFRLMSPP